MKPPKRSPPPSASGSFLPTELGGTGQIPPPMHGVAVETEAPAPAPEVPRVERREVYQGDLEADPNLSPDFIGGSGRSLKPAEIAELLPRVRCGGRSFPEGAIVAAERRARGWVVHTPLRYFVIVEPAGKPVP